MKRLATFLALLFLFGPAVPAQSGADVTAQSTIDKGEVTFTSSFSTFPIGQFRFEGPQMSLIGGLRADFFHPQCGPCLPGQQVSIGAQLSFGTGYLPGTVTIGNADYDVYFDSSLDLHSSSVTLPIRYSRLPFRVSATVTAQGTLKAYASPQPNTLLFTFPVKLNGTATLTLQVEGFNPSGQPFYKVKLATFVFPVAEKMEKN